MQKIIVGTTLFFLLLLSVLVSPPQLQAETLQERLTNTATGDKGAGFAATTTETTLATTIGAIIKIFLSLIGVIFVYLLVNGGYKYMTAGGEEENIKKAKQEITAAIIGLIVTVAAWSISQFVLTSLTQAVTTR